MIEQLHDRATTLVGGGIAALQASTVDIEKVLQRDKGEIAKVVIAVLTAVFGWLTNRRKK